LAVYCHPVFKWECKGKGRFIITKIFSDLFSVIWSDCQILCEELSCFFKTDGKNTTSHYSSQFLFQLLFTQRQHCYELVPFYAIHLFQKSAAKIRRDFMLPNLFETKTVKHM
jgi:hypothetical protein